MEEVPDFNCAKSNKQYAILIQNLSKSYGKAEILRNVSMHVEEGTVYGLLGGSGCGKTTVLNCILNLKTWNSGEVFVFGKRVDKTKEIEARDIGYMPQDMALYDQLTVEEMMRYYSKLYGMSSDDFNKVIKFLEDLMNLPGYSSRKICTLSGGQQRRISLSLTLIHKPRLLILDEPTVGLDPLLRESLWNYLQNLTITNKTTLVITTHYIEEVKRANTVGVMRKGRLLVEEDPAALMRAHQTLILEEVVRKICFKDAQDHGINSLLNNGSSIKDQETIQPVKMLRFCCSENNICNEKESCKDIENQHNSYPNASFPAPTNDAHNETIQVQIISKENNLCNNNNETETQSEMKVVSSIKRSLAYSKVVLINFIRNPVYVLHVWVCLVYDKFVCIVFFLPPFQLFTTGTVFGVEPKFTPIGVVNHEVINWQIECSQANLFGENVNISSGNECDLSLLSCHYLNNLCKGDFIKLVQFESTRDAHHAVEQGNIKGYIQIPDNFSQHIIERAVAIQFASEETINGTTIRLDFDLTDFIKMYVVTSQMFQAFDYFVKELTTLCNFDLRLVDIPFNYKEPVYGIMDGTAQEYALPAMIAGILFEISYCITPLVFVKELKSGTLERSNVAGLHFTELMAGLIFTMTAISLIQGLICYVSMEYFLDLKVHGNPILYFGLCIVSVLCGGTFGLFTGVIFKDEITVIISAIFILPILMLYVGMLRPEEIIPLPFRSVVYYFFPSAAIVKSFRFVINRGVGLFHIQVWPGILITLAWAAAFSLLSLITIKRSKS